LEAVQIGHPDIDDRQVRNELGGDGKRIARRTRAGDLIGPAQYPLNGAKHAGLVVDDQDSCRFHEYCGCGCCATACGTPMWTRVPLPGSLWMVSVPSTSHSTERQIDRP